MIKKTKKSRKILNVTVPKKMRPKALLLAVLVASVVVLAGILALRAWYSNNLLPVNSSQTSTKYFTVEQGASVSSISKSLKSQALIKNSQAFETYVRSNNYYSKLQAGTYSLSPSMGVKKIVEIITSGNVARDLLTILPGKRLDQVMDAFITSGYTKEQVDEAFEPSRHINHPALASLSNNANLEGYLYPESFQKIAETPPETIIRQSLDEMSKRLTPAIVSGFAKQGLNTFQGITLASIVEQESGDADDQAVIAQVLLRRYKENIPLGADPTATYASVLEGKEPSVTIDSPYNTRIVTGLPPGPIGTVTETSLQAVASPSTTTYLFFVSGDDGKLYPSNSQAEHDELIKQYCKIKCNY